MWTQGGARGPPCADRTSALPSEATETPRTPAAGAVASGLPFRVRGAAWRALSVQDAPVSQCSKLRRGSPSPGLCELRLVYLAVELGVFLCQ